MEIKEGAQQQCPEKQDVREKAILFWWGFTGGSFSPNTWILRLTLQLTMKSDADNGDAHIQHTGSNHLEVRDYDTLFGGPEERKRLEKKLLRKVDTRMSILIVIYILNYVSSPSVWSGGSGTMREYPE